MINNLPPKLGKKRYHDLDALRAFAMLLGIGLHGFMSFVPLPIPVWPAQDMNQHEGYLFALHAIHGFRMQLFFLISGFFTTMIFRQRGIRGLIQHRAKRILLPLVVFTIILSPTIMGIGIYGGGIVAKRDSRETIWAAARSGDIEAIQQHLAREPNPNQLDAAGITPLSWTALLGRAKAAKVFIEKGADLDARNNEGSTALHKAAFMGEVAVVKLLVENGADINVASKTGDTPLSVTEVDVGTTRFIAGLLKIPLDGKKMEVGRREIVSYLTARGAVSREAPVEKDLAWLYPVIPGMKSIIDQLPDWARVVVSLMAINWVLAIIPIFQHLWFLYYLVWLIAGFAVVSWIARKRSWKPVPAWFVASPLCLLWLVPLSFVPQFFMVNFFGPDTAASFVPWPPMLLYFGVFFGFGAVCHGQKTFEKKVGHNWPLSLLLAIPVLLLGLHWFEFRGGLFVSSKSTDLSELLVHHSLSTLFSVLYAWLMIFGMIGLFRRFFSSENRCIRYISDASYWLYVMHLPPIMLLQIWTSDWVWPGAIKFLGICVVTTGILLVIYEYAVRYSFIGTMLNGKKTRT